MVILAGQHGGGKHEHPGATHLEDTGCEIRHDTGREGLVHWRASGEETVVQAEMKLRCKLR